MAGRVVNLFKAVLVTDALSKGNAPTCVEIVQAVKEVEGVQTEPELEGKTGFRGVRIRMDHREGDNTLALVGNENVERKRKEMYSPDRS